MNCFLLGADSNKDAWLIAALRARGARAVVTPRCDQVQINLEAEGPSTLVIRGRTLIQEDRLLFLRVPYLPLEINSTQRDFAYSEWRAALEAALHRRSAQVWNGEWVLRNFWLRSSDVYWTRLCQRVCAPRASHRFEWRANVDVGEAQSAQDIEVVITSVRWITEQPLLYEVERHEASWVTLQELIRIQRLDFLRVWIDASSPEICISRASAEMPAESSLAFETALDDLL